MKEYGIDSRTGKSARDTVYIKNKQKEYSKSLEVKEQRICENCGAEFFIQPHKSQKNCCRECAAQSTAKKLESRVVVLCANCGRKIYRIPSRGLENNFCDMKCHGEWKSNNLKGENNHGYERINRKCSNCGKELSIIASRAVKENVYCNIECMGEHYSESLMFSGENSHVWSGGKIKRNEYGANWMMSRRKVREREFYMCARCGKTEEDNGQELSIHHIKNFKLFDNYNDANHLDNLVGLCRECHTYIHSSLNINNEYISEDIV